MYDPTSTTAGIAPSVAATSGIMFSGSPAGIGFAGSITTGASLPPATVSTSVATSVPPLPSDTVYVIVSVAALAGIEAVVRRARLERVAAIRAERQHTAARRRERHAERDRSAALARRHHRQQISVGIVILAGRPRRQIAVQHRAILGRACGVVDGHRRIVPRIHGDCHCRRLGEATRCHRIGVGIDAMEIAVRCI